MSSPPSESLPRRRDPRWPTALTIALGVAIGLAMLPALSLPGPAAHPSADGGPVGAGGRSAALAPPLGALGSLQVAIYNPGANATGIYDQPVGINSSRFASLINANWTNGLADYSGNNTPVYGWIESGASNRSVDTLMWLRLQSIPGHSWENVSIWFWPQSSFNLSENGYLGEAPDLSARYAEFDNGWRVFDGYWNFSGSTLPAGWTPLGSWAGTVHDGLTVATSYRMGAVEFPLARPYASNLTVETDARLNSSGDPVCLFLAETPGFSGTNQFFPSAYALEPGLAGTAHAGLLSSDVNGAGVLTAPLARAPVDFRQAPIVVGLSWSHANASETGSANYLPFVSQVNATNGPMGAIGLGSSCNLNCSTWNVTWTRARSVPDPMPIVSGQAFAPIGVAVTVAALATDANHPVLLSCNASTALSPIASYTWTFGDGQTGVGPIVTHAFGRPGTYFPECTASSSSGAAGSSSLELIVNPNLAILLFQAVPSTFPLGSSLTLLVNVSGGTPPFTFTYSGLPPGCPPPRSATVSCLPGETGTFGIEVSVSDSTGEQASNSITITVTLPSSPGSSPSLSPVEGYALAGGVAGVVVLAGVLPVLLWSRRSDRGTRRGPRRPLASEGELDTDETTERSERGAPPV